MNAVINISGTLKKMEVGDEIILEGIKGSSLRNTASKLKEDADLVISVNKIANKTFRVRRNA